MGGCVHRAKKPIAPPAISPAAREFLSYVRPLDLIVFRDTMSGPIDRVEVVITLWWRETRRMPVNMSDHADKAAPPRRAPVGPFATTDSITEATSEEAVVSSDAAVQSIQSAISLSVSPIGSIRMSPSTHHMSPIGMTKTRAVLMQDNIAEVSWSDDESTIATGRKGTPRQTQSLPARINAGYAHSTDPDVPIKLYVWGEQEGTGVTMCTRVVRMRALADLVQVYIDHPTANIGVCRLNDNPTVIGTHEPEHRFTVRANRVRGQIGQAYAEFLSGRDCDDDIIGFAAAMFPTVGGLASADVMDIERFMRNNAWLRRSTLAAVIYTALGAHADFDESESLDVGPIDFSGEYMVGPLRPICELPPYWVKR